MGIYINNNGTIERKDGAPGPAGSIAYDNTESGLVSNNVQNAIDEVNERVIENISDNASIELTATAAHAHAVGTSFMLIGQLVKTTSAIAVGDTIAVGTNVEPTSVLDLLGDVNTAISALNRKKAFMCVPEKSMSRNSNFNDYIDPGTYAVPGNSWMQTLSNRPADTAGMLVVMDTMGFIGYVLQWFVFYTGSIYYRFTSSSGASWSTWTSV